MWARQRAHCHPLQGAQCQGTNISKAILRQSEAKNAIGQWVTQIACRRGKLCAKTTTKARLTLFEKSGFADGATAHRPRHEMQSTNVRNSHTEIQSTHRSELDDHSQQTKSKHIPPAGERARAHREARVHACAQVHTHTQARAC